MCYCDAARIRAICCGSTACHAGRTCEFHALSYNSKSEETKMNYELAWKRMCLLYPIVYGANCATPTLDYSSYDGFAVRGRSNGLIGKGATIEYAIQTAYTYLRGRVLDMQVEQQKQIDTYHVALDGKIDE